MTNINLNTPVTIANNAVMTAIATTAVKDILVQGPRFKDTFALNKRKIIDQCKVAAVATVVSLVAGEMVEHFGLYEDSHQQISTKLSAQNAVYMTAVSALTNSEGDTITPLSKLMMVTGIVIQQQAMKMMR